jgi:hypothetical protein
VSEQFKVVGPCKVAGVEPGGTVSRQALEEAGANIDALLGVHLKPVTGEAKTEPETEPKAEEKPAPRKPAK